VSATTYSYTYTCNLENKARAQRAGKLGEFFRNETPEKPKFSAREIPPRLGTTALTFSNILFQVQ